MKTLKPADVMRLALAEAEAAGRAGDVPVGAVVVSVTGEVLALGQNRVERDGDAWRVPGASFLIVRFSLSGRRRLRGHP